MEPLNDPQHKHNKRSSQYLDIIIEYYLAWRYLGLPHLQSTSLSRKKIRGKI